MDISSTLSVEDILHAFVEQELLPGAGVEPARFWAALEAILADFGTRNAALLARRDELQAQIDAWWKERRGKAFDVAEETEFLREIGYLVAEPAPFHISTQNVDPEIAKLAGPQLVVPVSNGRYALNAANARWGSLYDALYGTDALEPPTGTKGYDPVRGGKVIAYARKLLDEVAPLGTGSHAEATGYAIVDDALLVSLGGGRQSNLANPDQLAGWRGGTTSPNAVLLRHNDLHLEIQIDREHSIGKDDAAGVFDVLVEAALTAIQDCEDSVAAVDAEDKANVYRNWLGLMRGDLSASFAKGGRTETRRLDEDRRYATANGGKTTLRGRSLMLVRNVGHHMLTDIVRVNGQPVYETAIDALITVTAALHDIKGERRNSPAGSVYIVKPKMHGPDEVALACACSTRSRMRSAWPATPSSSASWTRSAAPAPTWRPASTQRASASSSSTPASSTAPATRSTPPWKPARWCARTPSRPNPGWPPTKSATSRSGWRPAFPATPRSARACGPRPT